MFYIFLLALIFISIAIAKNKNFEYLKQSAFAVMVLSILVCLILSRLENGRIINMGFLEIGFDRINLFFNFSIVIALVSLIVYLLADADR